ncbi:bZIP transcription factor [Cordyceps javanica]|uniref:BZIP transcription factor n=1 Tax=Cordyceps javanica TaxID=43265 RepID=A0A545VGU3_9HYPO|nr:bZIP transcription factor [Cordyceps javanica]TQW12107.1 bZIP transcription factor [Cordyceps javanica]
MDTKTPPKPKRTLTEAQLGNKRRIDKLKHRENRAESKTRLENIERDVSFLRHTIGDVLEHLRQLNAGSAPPHHQHNHNHNHHPHAASHSGLSETTHQQSLQALALCPPKTEPWSSPPDPTTPLTSTPAMPQVGAAFYNPADHLTERLYSQHIFPQEPLESQMDMEALLAEIRGQGPVVECRCGKQHSADVQCTERIAVIMAVEFSNVSNHASMRAMTAPRNPGLLDMLLHHTDMSNPLAIIMSSILRQYDIQHIDSLCGIFLLAYRLLRAQALTDVPAIMRPTQAQITIPHPKALDFIPFPALRNYLCLNQHKDARHTVDLYLRSMRLVLPPGKNLMTKTERGGVDLNPEFEVMASDLRNWTMGPPWSEYFPQLRQFLY